MLQKFFVKSLTIHNPPSAIFAPNEASVSYVSTNRICLAWKKINEKLAHSLAHFCGNICCMYKCTWTASSLSVFLPKNFIKSLTIKISLMLPPIFAAYKCSTWTASSRPATPTTRSSRTSKLTVPATPSVPPPLRFIARFMACTWPSSSSRLSRIWCACFLLSSRKATSRLADRFSSSSSGMLVKLVLTYIHTHTWGSPATQVPEPSTVILRALLCIPTGVYKSLETVWYKKNIFFWLE